MGRTGSSVPTEHRRTQRRKTVECMHGGPLSGLPNAAPACLPKQWGTEPAGWPAL